MRVLYSSFIHQLTSIFRDVTSSLVAFSPYHILDRITIHVSVHQCIQKDNAALPAIKVESHIEPVKLYISDHKLLSLLALAKLFQPEIPAVSPAVNASKSAVRAAAVAAPKEPVSILKKPLAEADDSLISSTLPKSPINMRPRGQTIRTYSIADAVGPEDVVTPIKTQSDFLPNEQKSVLPPPILQTPPTPQPKTATTHQITSPAASSFALPVTSSTPVRARALSVRSEHSAFYTDDDGSSYYHMARDHDDDDDDEFASACSDLSTAEIEAIPASAAPTVRTTSTSSIQSSSDQPQLQLDFELAMLGVVVSRQDAATKAESRVLELRLDELCVRDFRKGSLSMTGSVSLGALSIIDHLSGLVNGKPTHLLKSHGLGSKEGIDKEASLITVSVRFADPKHPAFAKTFGGVQQAVDVRFGTLQAFAIQETVRELLLFATETTGALNALSPKPLSASSSTGTQQQVVVVDSNSGKAVKSNDSIPSVDVNLSISSLEAVVGTRKTEISRIALTQLAVKAVVAKETLNMHASIKNMSVVDATQALGSRYFNILQVQGQELFNLNVTHHLSDPSKRFPLDFDTFVHINVCGVRVIVLNRFISELSNFSALAFPTAANAEHVQRSDAPQSAVPELSGTIENPLLSRRIKLSVEIKAPIIVLPSSTTSNHAIVLDLGTLLVDNQFEFGSTRTWSGQREIVLDRMNIGLHELELFLATVASDDADVTVARKNLLQSLSFNVPIVRSLHTPVRDLPGVDISCVLRKVLLSLDEEDIADIVQVASHNFAEKPVIISSVDDDDKHTPADASDYPHISSSVSVASVDDGGEMARAALLETWTTLNLNVRLESFELILRSKATDDTLTSIAIDNITAAATMQSDGLLMASFALYAFNVNDLRREASPLATKIVSCKGRDGPNLNTSKSSLSSQADNPFIVCDFRKMSNQQSSVVRVNSLRVFACLDYLAALKTFLASSSEHSHPASQTTSSSSIANPSATSAHEHDDEADNHTHEVVQLNKALMNTHIYVSDVSVSRRRCDKMHGFVTLSFDNEVLTFFFFQSFLTCRFRLL